MRNVLQIQEMINFGNLPFAEALWGLGRDAEALVLEARIHGFAIEALCGKKWVPSRDPERFPICPACAALAKGLRGAR